MDSRVILYTAVGVGSQDTASLLVEITSEALDSLELREEEEVFLVIKSSSILVLG